MGIWGRIIRISSAIAVMLIYLSVLWLGLTEEKRRSLAIVASPTENTDFVIVNVRVTSIDTAQGLLHGRIRLIPMGRFSIDKTTPSTDLTLLVNSVSGRQAVVFPQGERIVPVEFSTL